MSEILINPAQEGFLRDLKDRHDMKKTTWIKDAEVVKALEVWKDITPDIFDHILTAKTFKMIPDCGYYFKYFYRVHGMLVTFLMRTAIPVFKKYNKITSKDAHDFEDSRSGIVVSLEEEARKTATTIKENEYYLGAQEFRGLKRIEDTFQRRGFDRNRLKQILVLWKILHDRWDNGKAEKIMPWELWTITGGDHDDGLVNVLRNHKLPTLLGDPTDFNRAFDLFSGFQSLISAVVGGVLAFDELEEDVNWITKRIIVLLKAKKVI